MAAGIYNLTLEQGADLAVTLTWTDSAGAAIDITNYTARMQGRQTIGAAATLFDLTSGAGEIVLGGAAGTIAFPGMDAALTTAMTFTDPGFYDLELISAAGVVTRLVQGTVTLDLEVTT